MRKKVGCVVIVRDGQGEEVVLEGFAKRSVIDEVNSFVEIWAAHDQIIADIQGILRSERQWSIRFSQKEGNKAAHLLAKHALQIDIEYVWLEDCPDVVQSSVLLEK
ncbi:hypothetical protein I3760_07G086500 [Carya illinoinensis]|nr:hypothetical protein I3760_07G086500 [Carya illinoinensis]